MSEVVKRVSLTQPAPIQIDSTEPEVIEAALERIPGRAIVNSINLEAGRDKLDRVVPLASAARRGADRADDRRGRDGEDGRAQARDRAADQGARLRRARARPELLIFDALTFTLTTGDDEWKPVGGRDDRGDPRDQGRASPASRPRWGSRTSRSASASPPARSSTRSSCTTASRPGSTWRWSTRTTSRPTPRSPRTSASSPTTSSTTAARTRSSGSSRTSSRRARRRRRRPRTRPRAWSPRRPCTGTSCAARRTGSRSGSTARSRRSAPSRP